jgi:hypothetical protein
MQTSANIGFDTARNSSTRAHEHLSPPTEALQKPKSEVVSGVNNSTDKETSPPARGQVVSADSSEDDEDGTWESGALTSKQALKRYSDFLTAFERSEILLYQQVSALKLLTTLFKIENFLSST